MNEPQSDVEIPPWDVADRMGKAMHASGVTLAEMALYLGCHRNTVTNYLRGRSKPSRATLIAWADKTRFPLDWLETGEQSANPPPDGRPLRVTGNDRYPVCGLMGKQRDQKHAQSTEPDADSSPSCDR